MVLGRIRYMSSDNTLRKFRMRPWLDYVESLPTIAAITGKGAAPAALPGQRSLF